jgi:hypothetical protein
MQCIGAGWRCHEEWDAMRIESSRAHASHLTAPLALVSVVPFLCGFTRYYDLAAWEAAVGGAHEIEDFESFPELRLPIDGGITDFGRFVVENDDQGNNEWSGGSGLYRGSNWYAYPEIPDTMNLIVSAEGDGSDPTDGPTYIEAVFPTPIIAYAFDYSWLEDDVYPAFFGVLLDDPGDRAILARYNDRCEHSWCAIDAIRWVPASAVPEPATASLLALGLSALAFQGTAARRKR